MPPESVLDRWIAATSPPEATADQLHQLHRQVRAEYDQQRRRPRTLPPPGHDPGQDIRVCIYAPAVLPQLLRLDQPPPSRQLAGAAGWLTDWAAFRDPARTAGVRWWFLLGEAALQTRTTSPGLHLAQLAAVQAWAAHPAITLGILPLTATLPVVVPGGFGVVDTTVVAVDTLTGPVVLDDPDLPGEYAAAFGQLWPAAIYGHDDVHALLAQVVANLPA